MPRPHLLAGGAFAALATVLLVACQAPLPEVKGWRRITSAEAQALTEARRAEHPEQPAPVTEIQGDFNADGKPDRVVLMVNEAEDRFSPYLFDGAGAAPTELVRGDSRGRMSRYSLATLGAGAVYDFCIEDGHDEASCERDKALRGQIILFYEVDNGGSIFAWNGASFVERTIHGHGGSRTSSAAPAGEHPLAHQPWWTVQSQMPRNPDLPTFHRVSN
jgi:hypothetical protein